MMSTDRKIIRVREVMKQRFDKIDGRITVMEALRTMKHVDKADRNHYRYIITYAQLPDRARN